jgi:outer membrane biogenesis lipoprotein LolB
VTASLQKSFGEQRRMMWRCFFVCTTLAVVVSFSACTTTQLAPTGTSAAVTGDGNMAPYFSLAGRISVRVNDKLDSGQIRWQRSAMEERIGLFSPLGSQVAELISDARTGAVTLRQGKETVTAGSVPELTQALLGVPLDLERVAQWVQGVGLRENEVTDVTLASGESWRVTAERYSASGNYRFASRVIATRGDIAIRLVIDEWAAQ